MQYLSQAHLCNYIFLGKNPPIIKVLFFTVNLFEELFFLKMCTFCIPKYTESYLGRKVHDIPIGQVTAILKKLINVFAVSDLLRTMILLKDK